MKNSLVFALLLAGAGALAAPLLRGDTAPVVSGVTLDGTAGDTLVVSGSLDSFPGDSCALRVLVGLSAETMTSDWADLAGSTLVAPGAFSLTLHEADMEGVRYLAPNSTYFVAVVATASTGDASTTPAQSVTMSPKDWTYVEEGLDRSGNGQGYATDGAWKLTAKRTKNTTQLTLSGSGGKFYGATPSPMNFTHVRDADDVAYQVVEFGTVTGRVAGQNLNAKASMLTELVAPDCVRFTSNLQYIFNGCSSMTNVCFNADFNVLVQGAFSGCSSLRTIYPRRMMCATVPYECFRNGASLEGDLEFPACTSIGGYAFANCSHLESVVATNATLIDQYAFSSCSSLSEVAVSTNVTQVSISGFNGCSSLAPDSLGKILGKSLRYLGYTNFQKMGEEFRGCSSLAGPLVWDFPNLATNVVNANGFYGCSALGSVIFKTPVAEIRNSAFFDVKEGAELYMHAEAPILFGPAAISRMAAPYPKVYLKDNFDEWLAVMNVSHDLMLAKDFDNKNWSSKRGNDTITWATMAAEMAKDTTMCSVEKTGSTITKVNVLDRKVIGFMLHCNVTHKHYMSWVLRAPVQGTTLFVR